ncbi:HK97 family phage prohead protease [Streptomyces acidiscabies]|uniref:HK97 family phage prohead protease n=1 Tax=Streptomyces acidiscabies TaxID=42234 RepID=UPI000950C4FF|nr:HK97 family phage prohead protease [Streptomyces acidiscabies]
MPHPEIQRRTAPLAVSLRSSGGVNTISGYAIRFNELSSDLGGFRERIDPGAWNPATARNDVLATFNHNVDNVLGRRSSGTLRLTTDTQGVRYEIDIPNTRAGSDVAELIKRGDVIGSSFTFRVNPGGQERATDDDPETGLPVRVVTSMTVYELGPVTNPAYPTTTANARALETLYPLELESRMTNSPIRTADGFLPVNRRAIPNGSEWTVTEPAALWVNMIGPKSRFLANIPASNKLPMHEASMMLPAIKTADGGYTDANTPIPEPGTEATSRTARATKFGALEKASTEVLQDARPDLVAGINQSLAAAMARGIDNGLFNGAGPADPNDPRRVIGLLAQGDTKHIAPSVAEISAALERMESTGAEAATLWVDPVAAKALRAEIPASEWPKGIYGLTPIVSKYLPVNTAVVADTSRIFVGLHSDVSITVSRVAPEAFGQDRALFRALARVAGVWVQESGSVQIISATLPDNIPDLMAFADMAELYLNSPEMLAAKDAEHAAELAAVKADPSKRVTFSAQQLTDDDAQKLRTRQRQAKAQK